MPVNNRQDTIYVFELNELIEEFTEAVSEKRFVKMEYSKWRHLTRDLTRTKDEVHVSWDYDSITLHFTDRPALTFYFDDESFGRFLYEVFVRHNSYEVYDLYDSWESRIIKEEINFANKSTCSAAAASDVSSSLDLKVDKAEFEARLSELAAQCEANFKSNENIIKENETMKPFNFDFGPVNANTVRMSMYGLAVKNKSGTWVSYNPASDEIMDVEIFNFDGAQFLYRMPVAISTIQTGDVIVHAGVPMFVEQVLDKSIYAIDPVAGEKKEVLLTKSPFGFNFATKVVNFLDGFMGSATPNTENPFGNMWMLMALNGNGDMDMSTIAMMVMANGQNGLNPQMMLPLLLTQNGKGNMNENLAMVMAMQAMNQPHVCHCHNNGDQ